MRRIITIAMQLYNILLNNYIYLEKKSDMIQRVQTLYIVIGILLILGTACFLPQSRCDIDTENIYLFSSYGGIVWLSLFLINSIVSVFLFKNRKKQIYHINGSLYAIFTLLLVLLIFDFLINQSDISLQYHHSFLFDAGVLMGALSFFLARKSIKSDEDLINSIHRLR